MKATGKNSSVWGETASQAVKKGESGCSCSEAILVAYGPRLGMPEPLALKTAACFGGGMALMGETCGAVTAAFMVLGLRFGADSTDDLYARQNSYIKAAEFVEEFQRRMGSLICRELCKGHSMSTPGGAKALRESGLPAQMIKCAGEILDGMLGGGYAFKKNERGVLPATQGKL